MNTANLKNSPGDSNRMPVLMDRGEYLRRKWGRKLVIFGSVMVVLMALGIWLGPSVLNQVKIWRARKLVEFADVQKKAGNQGEMKNLLLQAFALTREDPVVLRAMAEDYAGSPAERLQFLQVLATRRDATRDDRLKLCRLALESRLLSYARAEFEEILKDPESKKDPEFAEVASRYLTLQGDTKKAIEWTNAPAVSSSGKETNPSQSPDTIVPSANAKLNLIRARLLLDTEQPDEAALRKAALEVVTLLSAVTENGTDAEQRSAALLLARLYSTMATVRDVMGPAKANVLLGRLGKWFDDAKWETRLVATDLRNTLQPAGKDSEIEKLITSSRQAPESARLELARWLNSRGQPAKAQELAENATGDTNVRDWFLIRLDAMAAQKQWQKIEAILKDSNGVPIEEILGRLFLWRCARELGAPPADLERARQQILEAGKKSASAPDFFAAGYLERMGDRDTAVALYQKYVDDEAMAGPAFLGLVRCFGADVTKTSALKDTLEKMLAKYPNVSEAKNDLAYFNLLDGKKLNESIQTATMLMTDSPHTLAYRTTMALAELVRGNYKAADLLYANINLDWSKVTPGWTAVRASVLAANGKENDAAKLASIIDQARLREGEKKLLGRFVQNKGSDALPPAVNH